jgi:uncharacterized protein involved in exopolysaccharide biosynthesis
MATKKKRSAKQIAATKKMIKANKAAKAAKSPKAKSSKKSAAKRSGGSLEKRLGAVEKTVTEHTKHLAKHDGQINALAGVSKFLLDEAAKPGMFTGRGPGRALPARASA